MKTFTEIAKECQQIAEDHGFVPKKDIVKLEPNKWYLAAKMALIGTEVSEMVEALREDNLGGIIEEGIDVIIRTLEFLAGFQGVDVDEWFWWKMEKNKTREIRHGGKLL